MDTSSEAWRLECEARLILTMPLGQRREYLSKLKPDRRLTLEGEMRKQWSSRSVQGTPEPAAAGVNSSSAIG